MPSRSTSAYPEHWDPNYRHPTNVGEMLALATKRAIAIQEEREAREEAEREHERRMRVPVQRSVSPLQVLVDRIREVRGEKRGLFKRLLDRW